ncbi:MAG: ribonuclease HII [Actinomycetota bacterium]
MSQYGCVVGLDEVGRGAVAGPLTVGAVAINSVTEFPRGINDSKKLSARQRERLVLPIQEWCVAWSLGSSSPQEIDEWGIAASLTLAAHRALLGLAVVPACALLDGNINFLRSDRTLTELAPVDFHYSRLPVRTVVRGDQNSVTIAAASILAKVYRDAEMVKLAEKAPEFGFSGNKGYLSRDHVTALEAHGVSIWHRRSWSIPGKHAEYKGI